MSVFSWTEIVQFHNIRKFTHFHPEILNNNPVVTYNAKCKLHGTNAGIQLHSNGKIVPQSRMTKLSIDNDNYGFAKFVKSNEKYWGQVINDTDGDLVIYGEFVGKGIQQKVAVSDIPNKSFAVFAAKRMYDDHLIIEPDLLLNLVKNIPDTYVIPWHSSVEIDFSKSNDELKTVMDKINLLVSEVEKNDPWVFSLFGIKGTGEGLVYYPVSKEHLGYTNFCNLSFKAKGEAHKNIATAASVQLNPETAENINSFVELVLTEARLNQGANAVLPNSFDLKFVGKFINWVVSDVKKEAADELAASSLDWKQVEKALSNKARNWYIGKARSL